ncbi:MAG: 30S ribosomal protein S20 [Patescibacteria group bacterium]|nr:30S ribosomal protein S20 [bacterium]MDZ4227075.1 30S ribosomal protein S20 [Patescibacteria group bacterium]
MANTTSAKKAQRQADRRGVFNTRRRRAMKDAIKEVNLHITAKKASDAQGAMPKVYQAIDKAVKRGTINKNKAARTKSLIAKRLAALSK